MAAAPTPITTDQIARLRLQTLGIHPSAAVPQLTTPLEVVQHHLAMQSQDWRASRWAIGSRIPGCTEADVFAAYDRGEIVRSWPMRGTVHAVEAVDLKWMLDLMGVRALSGVQRRWDNLGTDEATLERARDVAIERLRGGKRATRAELMETMTDAGLDVAGQLSYHTVWYLAQTGTVVQGPTRDGEQELVLLDEWVPNPRTPTREEALADLGRRYLRARGPATLDDLVHWSKLTKGDCRIALDANHDDLVELDRDGMIFLMLREQFEQLDPDDRSVDAGVYALAGFDEHLLGYRWRDDVLAPEHATLVDPGRNGVFRWTIVSRNRVIATWKRTRRTRKVVVSVEPFTTLTRADLPKVKRAIGRYGEFDGSPIEIVD